MSEEQNAEIKETTPVVEATATPTEQNVPTPEVKTEETKTEAKSEYQMPKGLQADIVKLRRDKREAKAEIERLNKMVETKTTTAPIDEPQTSLLDDPDKYGTQMEDNITRKVTENIMRDKFNEKIVEESRSAINWTMEQPEIKGSMDLMDEVDNIIINDPQLSEVAKIKPMLAAKEAFDLWKTSKGIDDNSKKLATQGIANTTTPSAAPTHKTGSRTIADVKADFAKLNPATPEYTSTWNNLMAEMQTLVK